MGDWLLRIRATLDRFSPVVVVMLLLLVGGGGWVTYSTSIAPGVVTEERVVSSWETTGGFDHSATVSEPNPVYPTGRTLTNQSVYFTTIAPVLNGTFRFTYVASGGGTVNQTVSISLVVREIDDTLEGQDDVLWQTREPLTSRSVESVQPDETVSVPFTINVSETQLRTDRVHDELGGPLGETEVLVRTTVDVEGTINGNDLERSETYTLPLSLAGTTYRPADSTPVTEGYETVQPATVEQTYGPWRTVGGPLLLVGSLLALGGFVAIRRRRTLTVSEATRHRLRFEADAVAFDEWISTMQVPADAFDRPEVEASSLGDLVDFAIDTENRVIESASHDAYYVLDDGFLYTFHPPVDTARGRRSAAANLHDRGDRKQESERTDSIPNGHADDAIEPPEVPGSTGNP